MLMYGKPCLIPIVKTAKKELIKPNIVCTMIKYGGKKRGVGEGGALKGGHICTYSTVFVTFRNVSRHGVRGICVTATVASV